MTNPIIPWLGGKRRLAYKLIPLFPKHECYVEVFCGGAALYFLRPFPAPTEVINDINGELVNLYRVVQHHLEEFAPCAPLVQVQQRVISAKIVSNGAQHPTQRLRMPG